MYVAFYQVPAWAGGSGEGERFKQALTVKGRPTIAAEGQQSRFGSRTAPSECLLFVALSLMTSKSKFITTQGQYLQGNPSYSILCALLLKFVLYYESKSFQIFIQRNYK